MCHRAMSHKTLEEAVLDWNTHKCPWGSGTKVAWSVTRTLVEQMWDKLDLELDQIKGHLNSEGKMQFAIDPNYHQIRARAISECIAIFMPPFFATADDVVRESVKRHEARLKGEEYETPGLGHRRYESATVEKARIEQPVRPTGRARPATPAPPANVQRALRDSHKAMPDVFTPEVLAQQYKLDISVVNDILANN